MRYALAIFATILASPLACSSSEQFGGSASPFRVGSPESQGFSSAALEALYTKLNPARTRALLVIRRDTIVFEQYSDPDQKKHSTASLAKGLVGSLALLLVLDDGRVQLDAPASNYIPAWRTDPDKSLITLRQLATHTSGLEDSFLSEGIPPSELGWKGEYWEKRREAASFLLARDRARVRFMPGTRVAYSNTGYDMLAYAITASLRGGEFSDIRELVRERVMRPIGVPDTAWSVGYGSTSEVDGLPLVAIAGGGSYTARAVARVGRLLLNEGRWDGQRLFDPVLTQVATQSSVRAPAGEPRAALGWWTNQDGVWPLLPRDAFIGAGASHQILLVVPSLELIAVRNGGSLGRDRWDGDYWSALYSELLRPLAEAMEPQ